MKKINIIASRDININICGIEYSWPKGNVLNVLCFNGDISMSSANGEDFYDLDTKVFYFCFGYMAYEKIYGFEEFQKKKNKKNKKKDCTINKHLKRITELYNKTTCFGESYDDYRIYLSWKFILAEIQKYDIDSYNYEHIINNLKYYIESYEMSWRELEDWRFHPTVENVLLYEKAIIGHIATTTKEDFEEIYEGIEKTREWLYNFWEEKLEQKRIDYRY